MKIKMGHTLTVVLLIFSCSKFIAAYECCTGINLLVNETCSDGSNLRPLNCKEKAIIEPKENETIVFEIDENDILKYSVNNEYKTLPPDEYCMTKTKEDGPDVTLICLNVNEMFHLVRFGISIIRLIFVLISTLFLLCLFLVYIGLPELQDIEGKCIIIFSLSMVILNAIDFMGSLILYFDEKTCDVISFIFNFFALISFNWLTVLSFHIWRITIRPIFRKHLNWFLIYISYGFLLPIILLITAVGSHLTAVNSLQPSNISDCWLNGSTVVWIYFYSPPLIMALVSAVLQLWAAKKLWWDINRRDNSPSVIRLRRKCLMYMHLLLVLGLPFIIDISSYFILPDDKESYIYYIIDISNCSNAIIGGPIFFIFVILRKKALKALAKHGLFCLKFPQHWKKLVDEELDEKENEEATLTHYNTGV